MEAFIKINRIIEGYHETLGHGTLYVNDKPIFDFCTLERPNLHNKKFVSSIPQGVYDAEKIRRGSNGKKALLLYDTEPRTSILIHSGNYYDHTQGCILAGNRFADADKNGIYDVINSDDTVNKIFDLIPDNATIQVHIKKMAV